MTWFKTLRNIMFTDKPSQVSPAEILEVLTTDLKSVSIEFSVARDEAEASVHSSDSGQLRALMNTKWRAKKNCEHAVRRVEQIIEQHNNNKGAKSGN